MILLKDIELRYVTKKFKPETFFVFISVKIVNSY